MNQTHLSDSVLKPSKYEFLIQAYTSHLVLLDDKQYLDTGLGKIISVGDETNNFDNCSLFQGSLQVLHAWSLLERRIL